MSVNLSSHCFPLIPDASLGHFLYVSLLIIPNTFEHSPYIVHSSYVIQIVCGSIAFFIEVFLLLVFTPILSLLSSDCGYPSTNADVTAEHKGLLLLISIRSQLFHVNRRRNVTQFVVFPPLSQDMSVPVFLLFDQIPSLQTNRMIVTVASQL